MNLKRTQEALREPEKNPKLFFFEILLLAIALHFILVLVFKPFNRNELTMETQKRFTIILPAVTSENYKYCFRYEDPLDFIMPPEGRGFSFFRTLTRKERNAPPAIPNVKEDKYTQILPVPFNARFPSRTLEEFYTKIDIPLDKVRDHYSDNAPGVTFPLWSSPESAAFSIEMTGQNREEFLQILKKHSIPKTATQLVLKNSLIQDMPRDIRVEESCGIPELDLFAVRLLSVHPIQELKSLNSIRVIWTKPHFQFMPEKENQQEKGERKE